MTPEERYRLDYEQTAELLRALTDVRFKLLALVPTVSAAAIAVVSRAPTAAEIFAVGAVGLVANVGILLYEIRNTEVYDAAAARARELEARLGLTTRTTSNGHAGLALVYSAALGGWTYLVAWGGLRALGVGDAQKLGGAIAAAAAAVVLVALLRRVAPLEERDTGTPATTAQR